MTLRARLVIRGRVQGVWYRGSMVEEARRLHVAGWVQNEADGSVLAEIEGERDAIDRIVAWARQGPPGARVVDVEIAWLAPTGTDQRHFAIRR